MGFTSEQVLKTHKTEQQQQQQQHEEKKEKPVNTAHTYEHIKSIVLESSTEKKSIRKAKNTKKKDTTKPTLSIGL